LQLFVTHCQLFIVPTFSVKIRLGGTSGTDKSKAASGELDMVQAAPVFELAVDELATVAAVDTLHGKEFIPYPLDALLDPAMGAVGQGVLPGPAGTRIGTGEDMAEPARGVRPEAASYLLPV
jgi:hypothetical protein